MSDGIEHAYEQMLSAGERSRLERKRRLVRSLLIIPGAIVLFAVLASIGN